MTTAVVTGAGGFVGGHICAALSNSGVHVRAALRSGVPPDAAELLHIASFEDGRFVEALQGADCVVHVAGRAHVLGERDAPSVAETFRVANVVTTRSVAQAAASAGVRTLVLMSSVAAGTNCASKLVRDGSDGAPDTAYGRSKLEAERAVAQIAESKGMRWVALRPPMVYGEGMRGNPLRLFTHLAGGYPLPVVIPSVSRSMIYVGNLAEAVLAAVRSEVARGTFFVSDQALTVEEFARTVAAALNRKARLVPIPRPVLSVLARAAMTLNFSPRALSGLLQTLVVDGRRFGVVAGYQPRHSHSEGIRRTAQWFMTQRSAAQAQGPSSTRGRAGVSGGSRVL